MKKILGSLLILTAVLLPAQERARRIDDATLRAAGKTEGAGREWITVPSDGNQPVGALRSFSCAGVIGRLRYD